MMNGIDAMTHWHDHNGEVRSGYFPPEPIFMQLSKEFRKAGKELPWRITVKPSGTISMLNSISMGTHLIYNRDSYVRALEGGWL